MGRAPEKPTAGTFGKKIELYLEWARDTRLKLSKRDLNLLNQWRSSGKLPQLEKLREFASASVVPLVYWIVDEVRAVSPPGAPDALVAWHARMAATTAAEADVAYGEHAAWVERADRARAQLVELAHSLRECATLVRQGEVFEELDSLLKEHRDSPPARRAR